MRMEPEGAVVVVVMVGCVTVVELELEPPWVVIAPPWLVDVLVVVVVCGPCEVVVETVAKVSRPSISLGRV